MKTLHSFRPKIGDNFKAYEDGDPYLYREYDREGNRWFINIESFSMSGNNSDLLLFGLTGGCENEIVHMPKELAGEGIFSINGIKTYDHVYYIGEKAIVEEKTYDHALHYIEEKNIIVKEKILKEGGNCIIPPGSYLSVSSFSEDLQFIIGVIIRDTGSSFSSWGTEWDEEAYFCEKSDIVSISPQLLDHEKPSDSIFLNFRAIQGEKWAKQACSALKNYEIILECSDHHKNFYTPEEEFIVTGKCDKAYQNSTPKDNPIIDNLHYEISFCFGNLDCNGQKLRSVKEKFCSDISY